MSHPRRASMSNVSSLYAGPRHGMRTSETVQRMQLATVRIKHVVSRRDNTTCKVNMKIVQADRGGPRPCAVAVLHPGVQHKGPRRKFMKLQGNPSTACKSYQHYHAARQTC